MARQQLPYYRSDEPNIEIPLALSYNTRGIDAEDNVFTDLLDQRKINCIYEPAINNIGGKTTMYLVKRPGVADLGSTYGTSGQVAYLVEVAPGALALTAANHWVFSTDTNDIRVSDNATTTVIVTAAGYAPVYVDKILANGTDTVVLQARNASAVQRVFYSSTIGTWAEITDSDFTSLTIKGKMEFLDGYGFGLTSTNRIHSSDLNALGTWQASNYIVKQMTQDIPRGLAKYGKYLLAFGENTMEVFHNVGNPTGSPLELIAERALVGTGLPNIDTVGARHYYTTHGPFLFFIGNNPLGVYAYNGSIIEKVSPVSIDKLLASSTQYSISKVAFAGKLAIAIALDAPATATQDSILFFPEWKEWFQWSSTRFQPVTSDRIGHTFIGTTTSTDETKLFKLSMDSDNWQDDGTSITETVQFTLPTGGNHLKRMSMVGLIGDTARATSTVSVSFSDDDGQNWSTARTIDMETKTKMLRNCGSFRKRMVRLTHTANDENRLESFIARID